MQAGGEWLAGPVLWGTLRTREAVLVGILVCPGQLSAGAARVCDSAAHRFPIEFLEFGDGTGM